MCQCSVGSSNGEQMIGSVTSSGFIVALLGPALHLVVLLLLVRYHDRSTFFRGASIIDWAHEFHSRRKELCSVFARHDFPLELCNVCLDLLEELLVFLCRLCRSKEEDLERTGRE